MTIVNYDTPPLLPFFVFIEKRLGQHCFPPSFSLFRFRGLFPFSLKKWGFFSRVPLRPFCRRRLLSPAFGGKSGGLFLLVAARQIRLHGQPSTLLWGLCVARSPLVVLSCVQCPSVRLPFIFPFARVMIRFRCANFRTVFSGNFRGCFPAGQFGQFRVQGS